jgi:hypothetical protein
MSKDDIAPGGKFAMAVASILGLACAAVGGPAGVVAVVWNAIVLIGSRRKVGPRVGVTALGLAAIYALAALSGFAGSDPEDIDRHWSFRLAVVAIGCAVVGLTSALVWITAGPRRR